MNEYIEKEEQKTSENMEEMQAAIQAAEEAFQNKPFKKQLDEDLNVYENILDAQSRGDKIKEENGQIVAYDASGNKIILGPAPKDIVETAHYLFGDDLPEKVEFITINNLKNEQTAI